MMIRLLLLVCLGVCLCEVFSSDLECPCVPLKASGDARVTTLFGGRVALVTCGDVLRLAYCSHGQWSINVSCLYNNLQSSFKRLLPNEQLFMRREKRSPNNGKYQEFRRRVKVQRQIRAGFLKTKIDTTTPTIFRAHPGGTVYLACRIENLGTHSITWIRLKDNTVLAIDTMALTAEVRLSPIYEQQTETWLLGILGAQDYDDGQYECRVSTREPLKRVVTLQIIPADEPLHGPVRSGEQDLDFVLRNITALWEEVQGIHQEISYHLHDGHTEPNHDEILQEVETLHHEHHVHHLHHPHEGHNAHHDADLLQHLSEVHQHQDDHTAGQSVHGHLHGHGHSHDHHHGASQGEEYHGEEEHAESQEEEDDHHQSEHHQGSQSDHHIKHHENEDDHDAHNLHLHEDEHTYGNEHSNEHDDSDTDEDESGEDEGPAQARPGLALIPGRVAPGAQDDPWMHASCTLKPNVDTPEGTVRGSVVISQRKDKQGPVYFDLHITGIDVATTGRMHGFHVHERPVAQDSCTSTGGHFNPDHVVHGSPHDDVRHVGDLGNIEVDENGEVNGYIIEDNKVAFTGPNSIIGKSIVVHAGEDDLGQGGDAGSLATGNAGGRLACCTIHISREPYGRSKSIVGFRFKG